MEQPSSSSSSLSMIEIEEDVNQALEQAKELQDAAASHISKSTSVEQSLRQRAQSLAREIRLLRSLLDSVSSNNQILDPKLTDKSDEDLQRARCIMVDGDASAFLPGYAQGWFFKMFLGPLNVRAARKDVQLKVKEEYNSYRDGTALLFLPFPSMLLLLRSWVWDGCLLAFPVHLYQGFEAFVGLLLLRTALAGMVAEWQVVFCGILLVVMAAGNFANTVQTLVTKSKFKAMRRSKSNPVL